MLLCLFPRGVSSLVEFDVGMALGLLDEQVVDGKCALFCGVKVLLEVIVLGGGCFDSPIVYCGVGGCQDTVFHSGSRR